MLVRGGIFASWNWDIGLGCLCAGDKFLGATTLQAIVVDSLTWAGEMMKAGVQSLLLRTGTSDGAVCVPGIW